jgi:hypothetical protein
MTMTTTTLTEQLASMALNMATDHGTRTWRGGEAPMTANRFGGYDFTTTSGDTYRLVPDDNTVMLYRFTNGRAMLLTDEARFSKGFAHLAAQAIADAIR